MPNDAHWQGCVLGLGDDGVIYIDTGMGWEVHNSTELKIQAGVNKQ